MDLFSHKSKFTGEQVRQNYPFLNLWEVDIDIAFNQTEFLILHAPIPEYCFNPRRHSKRFAPKNIKNQATIDKNPRPTSTGSPTKRLAGKFIK